MTAPITRGRGMGRAPGGPARPAPGVAVEWVGPLFRPLTGRRGDIAGFAGFASRGPVQTPMRLVAAGEFDAAFGPSPDGSFLADAVHGFFANGGTTCWVVRAARRAAAATADTASGPRIRFTATSPGVWADDLTIDLQPAGGDRFALTLRAPDGRVEVWRNLTVETLPERFAPDATGTVSALVTAELLDGAGPVTPSRTVLAGGDDGLAGVTTADLAGPDAGAALLDDIAEIGLVVVPDLLLRRSSADEGLPRFGPDEIADAQARLVAAGELLRDRVVLLSHPDSEALADDVVAWRDGFDSGFAALYWPWLRTDDPARPGEARAVPPGGHVAGVIARSDHAAGPHKPPANEIVAGAVGVTVPVDDDRHGQVNEQGVNAIRPLPGRGVRVLGARTTSTEPQWRYLNVRRLLNEIEGTIAGEASWLVFEPDATELRDTLQRVVRQFLDDLWRAGGLDGGTAEEAYSVVIDESGAAGSDGRLIVEIGVRPPWPAEFVVVRIAVTETGASGAGEGDDGGLDR